MGRYYISHPRYKEQLKHKLGFEPYPGTLNLMLDEPFVKDDGNCILIEGFSEEDRTFGGCLCYQAKIMGLPCAVVRPERSSYPAHLIEIIAPVNLRMCLNLSDGDLVEVAL